MKKPSSLHRRFVFGQNRLADCLVFALAFVSAEALADGGASTKGTLVNVFNWIYGLIGVGGGIALLVQLFNAKMGNFLGVQDPRKGIISTLMYTALAFSVVAIIQVIKAWASASGSDIGSL